MALTALLAGGIRQARGDSHAPSPRPAAIIARGLSQTFASHSGEAVLAIEHLDIEVAQGDLVAILGPSGCGKSTLLRILSGLLPPSQGRVALAGRAPETARRALGMGWLAQDDGLLPWKSVGENVALALQLGGRRIVRADDPRIQALLARVGLSDSACRYPHELSGGMRQRAALARALVGVPAFLFLDEPFANLDELTRDRLGGLLARLRRDEPGVRPTTLLVTHSVVEAAQLADRVIALSPRPARVLLDLLLPRDDTPRRHDAAGFGSAVQRLKDALAGGA